jgi:aspartyl aminopeptidase
MNDLLFPFLAEAVTPWHAASALARRLADAGFVELVETSAWSLKTGGRYFVRRGGSALAAFVVGDEPGWSIAAAHTDSPGWRLKAAVQRPHASGVVKIGTEVYGSPIHSTWLDRPLAIAGRVFVKSATGPREVLVRTEPVGVFPNLAIHFNREVNKGFTYDLSEHLNLLAALGPDTDLQGALSRRFGFDRADWLSADLFAVDPSEPAALGSDGLFVASRIDNLTGCHAVVEALIAAADAQAGSRRTQVAVCFDQEEIGSSTWTGADSALLGDLLDRIHGLSGGTREGLYRAKAASFVLSVDAAHGVHPNWAGQHDEASAPLLGGGPVLKASARFSYATTGAGEALVRQCAEQAGVPLQSFVMKSTLTPGSTVGPITTSWTGIAGADVGIPIWAMHSCRETADRRDQTAMGRLVTSFYLAR